MLVIVFELVGCNGVAKNIFDIPPSPQELQQMSSIDVCKNLGHSIWKNNAQAYLEAKEEVRKRITSKEVTQEDCAVFAQMEMKKLERSTRRRDQLMNENKTTNTDCSKTITGYSCTSK